MARPTKFMTNRAETDQHKEAVIGRMLKLWKTHPDMRFGQLLGNVFPCGPGRGHIDPYHVEDFDLINRMEMRYDRIDSLREKIEEEGILK